MSKRRQGRCLCGGEGARVWPIPRRSLMWKRLAVPIVVLAWFAVPSVTGAAPDYTPANLTATVDSGGLVRLDWDDTQDPNFAWFGVRRSTDPNADKATWTRLPPNFTTSEATDAGLPPGT